MFAALPRLLGLALIVSFVCPTAAPARDFRRDMLPNARLVPGARARGCIVCHVNSNPSEANLNTQRNAFGMDVEQLVTEDGFEPFWGASLAAMDSDGDGYTNGEELQDPDGLALHRLLNVPLDENFPIEVAEQIDTSQLEVGAAELLSNPGLAESVPPGGSGNPTPTSTQVVEEPTPTETPLPQPTATPTMESMQGLDKDGNRYLDSRDLLLHLKDGLDRTQWLMFSTRWNQQV